MRVNINFPLSDQPLALAKRWNEWFARNFQSEIVFSQQGPYPHLTLLMGTTEEAELEDLKAAVAAFSSSEIMPPLSFTTLYRPDRVSPYVFLGVKQAAQVRQLKATLAKYVDGHLRLCELGNVETPPHVTVAYTPDVASNGPELPQCDIAVNWSPCWVALAEAGNHGTCVEIIEKWKSGEANNCMDHYK
jgi:2'-5' RNA ligase